MAVLQGASLGLCFGHLQEVLLLLVVWAPSQEDGRDSGDYEYPKMTILAGSSLGDVHILAIAELTVTLTQKLEGLQMLEQMNGEGVSYVV